MVHDSTVVTIRGLKATEEGKPAAVKVSFTAKKSGKASKYSYVSKVTVIDDKQAIVSAAATGVKTVTLTMVKDVASVASPVAITVKKGTAERAQKATANGKTITLAMDAKLTQGAYSVTITGLEDAPLTADFNVEKDETLTSYEISDNLVAKNVSTTTIGAIKYAALNQYGEKMTANEPTVTCSFGKVGNPTNSTATMKPTKPATATAQGEITVYDINPVLAIPGTKGTVVLVGAQDGGVTATKEVTYNTFAKATKGEIVGTYNLNSAELKSMKENDKIANYELLMKFTNQYDEVMSADDLKDSLTIAISGGLTGINLSGNVALETRTYKGEDYVAIKLDPQNNLGNASAGDATVIVTGNYSGMLINEKLTVAKSIVIKSMTLTAANGIYKGQNNELNYEFVDTDGNSVTSYADVVACDVKFEAAPAKVRIERAADGKAKVILDGTNLSVPALTSTTEKASVPVTITGYANKQTGGDYLVQTFTLTGYQERFVKGVTGLKDGVTTSISVASKDNGSKGKNIKIKSTDILLADQYSNKVTTDDKCFNPTLEDTKSGYMAAASGTAVYIATNGAFEYDVVDNAIIATPKAVGTATVYLKYKTDGATNVKATSTDYDAKFTITVYDTKGIDVSTLAIDSINNGYDVKENATLGKDDVVVKAVVGGVKTVIPESQYVVLNPSDSKFTTEENGKGTKTKTVTLKVQVTTWDSANTPIETVITKDYTVSKEDSKLFKVTGAIDHTEAISGNGITFGHAQFKDQFYYTDQYSLGDGAKMTATDLSNDGSKVGVLNESVTYTIDMVEAKDSKAASTSKNTGYTITSNGSKSANIKFTANGYYKFKVTVKAANGSTKTATFEITVTGA